MARACKGRRSISPHCHRLQYETEFEGRRYGWIAGKNTTDAHTRASEDTADDVGADIFAPFTPEAEKIKQNQRKMLPAHRSP